MEISHTANVGCSFHILLIPCLQSDFDLGWSFLASNTCIFCKTLKIWLYFTTFHHASKASSSACLKTNTLLVLTVWISNFLTHFNQLCWELISVILASLHQMHFGWTTWSCRSCWTTHWKWCEHSSVVWTKQQPFYLSLWRTLPSLLNKQDHFLCQQTSHLHIPHLWMPHLHHAHALLLLFWFGW